MHRLATQIKRNKISLYDARTCVYSVTVIKTIPQYAIPRQYSTISTSLYRISAVRVSCKQYDRFYDQVFFFFFLQSDIYDEKFFTDISVRDFIRDARE